MSVLMILMGVITIVITLLDHITVLVRLDTDSMILMRELVMVSKAASISSYYCSCNIGYILDIDDHGCTSEFIIIGY